MQSLISRLMFFTQAVHLHTASVYLEGEQVHLESLLGILTNTDISSCDIIAPPFFVLTSLSHSSTNRFLSCPQEF